MRSLNVTFLAMMLAIATACGGGMHLLHERQIRKNANVLVERARRALGCDLRLVSPVKDVSDLPARGKNLIVVAAVDNVLHFRIFDGGGKLVVDIDERGLTGKARQIDDLRRQLVGLWPQARLTASDEGRVIIAVRSLVGYTRALAGNDLGKAAQSLVEYLNIEREDGPVWDWYARLMDQIHVYSNHRQRSLVFLNYEQALRHNRGDSTIERRCADLALELRRYKDAQRHYTNLLATVPSDSKVQPMAAELEDLLAQSERGLAAFAEEGGSTGFEKAEKWFLQAIQHDPQRVACYDRLARLYRSDLRRIEDADKMIQGMVAKNPGVAMAHVYRWRYADEFLKSAAATDLQRALQSAAANGCGLRWMSRVKNLSSIPTRGNDLFILADVDHVLHFRIFDAGGKIVVDTDEKRLKAKARQIEDLRRQLTDLWSAQQLTLSEEGRVINAVASIVGYTPANDIQEALKLAPEDPEVLLAAAVASEQKPDAAAARLYFEKGFKKDPKNVALALGVARLETREKRLDKAEVILRQALQANPVIPLAFALAETLILQDKIAGKDQAAVYVAVLRNALRKAVSEETATVTYLETAVRFLEAEIPYQQKNWAEAIKKIELARALSGSNPALLVQLNVMLADCHHRMGNEEQRLEALRRAAEVDKGSDSARKNLAEALASSGKLDQAVSILLPLAARKPEWRLDLVRLLLQRAARAPRDKRNWLDVEQHLREAAMTLPQAAEQVALLRLDVLATQGRLQEARSLLSAVQAKDARNLRYRLALAQVTQRQGQSAAALQILDQAEKDLGPSLDLQRARLAYWSVEGGVAAKAAVAKLAETRQQVAAADRPAFLDRLGAAEVQLGEVNLGQQYWRELAVLQPDNVPVRLGLLDLALAAGDHAAAAGLVDEIRKAEGDDGTNWQFAQAALLIDKVRRGESQHLDEARRLAKKISERRPQWAMGVALRGDIEELAGSIDEAIGYFQSAVKLGNVPPSLVRRLAGLLNARNRLDEIDDLYKVLRDQGAASDDITIVKAGDAMRKQDFDGGIALARQVFADTSTNSSDHLALGRFYMTAGRINEAGKEFERAVKLGPGVPESWLTYVYYLVQTKQIDQARAIVLAAGNALPADRSTLALAECSLFLGDLKHAEDLVGRALHEEGKSADPAALRLAAKVAHRQNRLDKVNEYLDKLSQVTGISSSDKAWVNRIRAEILLSNGRAADRDQALALVDQNLRNNPESMQDQSLKANILAIWPGGRAQAVAILERLGDANRLGDNEAFLLAQLYLNGHDAKRYQDQMLKLVNRKVRNPRHLAHFGNYWIDRDQLDQADHWLAELKKLEPQGVPALELEARLLDVRKRKSELLTLLEARSREVPDQIGAVADLFNRYGFVKEAEEAYKAYVARDSRQPERALDLAKFLASQGRHPDAVEILRNAWKRCRHEAVARAGVDIYVSPSAAEPEKTEAARWLLQAAGERPDDPDLTTKAGFIYCQEGRFDEAEVLNRRVLAKDRDNAQALNNLANLLALHHDDKTAEALQLINRAITVHGSDPTLLDTRAVVLIRAGQSEQAIKDLREALDRNPKSANYALHSAWAYQAIGKTDEARAFFRRALELGFKADRTDALERSFIAKLRRDLSATEPTIPVDRKS